MRRGTAVTMSVVGKPNFAKKLLSFGFGAALGLVCLQPTSSYEQQIPVQHMFPAEYTASLPVSRRTFHAVPSSAALGTVSTVELTWTSGAGGTI